MRWIIRSVFYGLVAFGGLWLIGAFGIPYGAVAVVAGVVAFVYLDNRLDQVVYRLASLEYDKHNDTN